MNPKLGLFDSGLGGLTVLKRVLERHGEVPSVYLGDSARVPYGGREAHEIRYIAEEVLTWFRHQDISAIVMACNTTNSLAFDVVKRFARVPVFGLIGAAVEMIWESKVGVLATPATASSGAYRRQIEQNRPGTFIFEQSCPAFVPMIEAGQLSTNELRRIAIEYLAPLIEARVEAIVLGCTHYPLLEPLLRQLLPKKVRLIDPAIGLASQLDSHLGSPLMPLGNNFSLASTRFCVTEDPSGFAARATPWLGVRPEVELISLQNADHCF